MMCREVIFFGHQYIALSLGDFLGVFNSLVEVEFH